MSIRNKNFSTVAVRSYEITGTHHHCLRHCEFPYSVQVGNRNVSQLRRWVSLQRSPCWVRQISKLHDRCSPVAPPNNELCQECFLRGRNVSLAVSHHLVAAGNCVRILNAWAIANAGWTSFVYAVWKPTIIIGECTVCKHAFSQGNKMIEEGPSFSLIRKSVFWEKEHNI